jgi:N-formylglutamate deformylase
MHTAAHSTFSVLAPLEHLEIPLLIDSPHSGANYPSDFCYSVDFKKLQMAEDLFVNQLYDQAPSYGATLLSAEFPRSYLDVNRRVDDIDPKLLANPDTATVAVSDKTNLGMGLVWRLLAGEPIYSRFLSTNEIEARIENCYWPYINELNNNADRLYKKFNRLLHLNVHSMPDESRKYLGLPDAPLADIVLGNLDGLTCQSETIEFVADIFRKHGYSVAFNDPFKGVDIIRDMSNLVARKESLQIEVKRSLYAAVDSHTINSGFHALKTCINDLLLLLSLKNYRKGTAFNSSIP